MSTQRFAALLAMSLVLCNPVAALGQREGFIDGHVHLNDPEAWLQLMDGAGIEKSIVFRGRSIDNEGLFGAVERWPDRLIAFLSVSPEHREYRDAWMADDPVLVAVVDSLLRTGKYRGIGEISVSHFAGAGFPEADFDPNGQVMRAILSAARRHSVPVTVHIEVTRLREFEEMLQAYRDVQVIWAHGGYTPLVLAERMLRNHPNLTYELSARTWVGHPRSPDYTILRNGRDVWPEWLDLVQRMPDRFVVGTDASLRSIASDQEKIRSVASFLDQLPPPVRRNVARDNLARLLKIGS